MEINKPPNRTSQIVALLFANGLNLGINFITLPYLARSLSYDDYGTYGQLNMIGTLVTVIFSLGSTQVVNVLYLEYEDKADRVFSTNFWTFVVSGILALVLLIVCRDPIANLLNNPQLTELLPTYGMVVLAQVAATVYTTTIVYFGRTRWLAFVSVVSNLIRIGLLVVAISVFNSLHLAILALLIGTIVQVLGYLLVIPRAIRSTRYFDYSILREQLRLGYPMLAVALLGTGVFQIDGIVVSNFLGVEDFAIFRAGAIEVPFVGTIFGAVAAVLLPEITRLAAENKNAEIFELNKTWSSVTAIAVIPITLAMIFFGNELVTLYLSQKYAASGLVFSIYNIAVLMRLTFYQATLIAYKRSKDILVCFVIGTSVSLLLNLAFVSWFGVIGAAAAHPLTTFVLVSLLTMRTIRFTGQPLSGFFDWGFLAGVLLCSVALLTGIKTIHGWFPGHILLAGMLVLYVVAAIMAVRFLRPSYYTLLFNTFRRKYIR